MKKRGVDPRPSNTLLNDFPCCRSAVLDFIPIRGREASECVVNLASRECRRTLAWVMNMKGGTSSALFFFFFFADWVVMV